MNNYIGTNAAGTALVANGGSGITITGGNTQVGGPTAAERNVIAAKPSSTGILIFGSGHR